MLRIAVLLIMHVLVRVASIKEVLDYETFELGVLITMNATNELRAFATEHRPNDELHTAFHLHPHPRILTNYGMVHTHNHLYITYTLAYVQMPLM